MDTIKILNAVNKLHEAARATNKMKVLHNKEDFYLEFVGGNFEGTNNKGEYLVAYNTRKITQARKWFQEYLRYNV